MEYPVGKMAIPNFMTEKNRTPARPHPAKWSRIARTSGGQRGYDRPSPDHANAKVIFLISAHLESGHYFNPHAQRVMEGKKNGAKLIVVDVRLSNTATHADHWLAPYPGSEAAMLLAIAMFVFSRRDFK